MSINGKQRDALIDGADVTAQGCAMGIGEDRCRELLSALIERMPDALANTVDEVSDVGSASLSAVIADGVHRRADLLCRHLGCGPAPGWR